MSPILHAMTARHVELPFSSSYKHTNITDRDFLEFDACGNMIIDSDGLPRAHGLRDTTGKRNRSEERKRHITTEEGRKDVATEAIVAMLRTGKSFTRTEISDSTGISRATVVRRLKDLVDNAVCKTKLKRVWKKPVAHFYIPKPK